MAVPQNQPYASRFAGGSGYTRTGGMSLTPAGKAAASQGMSLGTAMTIAAVTDALSSAYSAYSTSKIQRELAELERQQYDMNAEFARLQGDDSIRRGAKASTELLTKTRSLIGAQRANIAGQNIRVDTGSAAEIQADTAGSGAIDALTIRNNAWREAWGYRATAAGLEGQGAITQIRGQAAAAETLAVGGANISKIGFDRYTNYLKYR